MASIRKSNGRVPADGRTRGSSSTSKPTLADIFNGHSIRSAINPQDLNPNDSNFSDILGRLTAGSDDSIMQLLRALGIDQNGGLKIPQRDDWNKQLLDTLTNYLLTLENRNYNESMRDEQRIYDSPTNQLARLMGAGVSRDAAIQMLSGGSQPIQSDAPSAAEGIAPSQSRLNGINAALAPIQTAFDAISAVGGLVSLGFSIPQAVQQTRSLKYGNFMNQQQQNAFNSVNSLTNALQTAVSNGVLTAQDLEGWSNANDAYKWLNDHADTNFVKPLADSGVLQGVFGSTLGREMFNSHWQQMRDARSGGDLYNSFLRQQHLEEGLKEVSTSAMRSQYYQTMISAFKDYMKTDVEMQTLWQQYYNLLQSHDIGQETLKQEQDISDMIHRQNVLDNEYYIAEYSALNSVDQKTGFSGTELISYSQFSQMIDMFEESSARTSSAKGNRDRLSTFYQHNIGAAATCAALMDIVSKGRLEGFQGDLGSLYKFADMLKYSGASDLLNTMVKAGTSAGGMYTGVKIANIRSMQRKQ